MAALFVCAAVAAFFTISRLIRKEHP